MQLGGDSTREALSRSRSHGATAVEDDAGKPASPAHFTGVGRKLGEPAAAALARSPTPTTVAAPAEPLVTITFWKNGFTVDDNPVRPYTEPQNQTFLNEIREGYVTLARLHIASQERKSARERSHTGHRCG